jgi:hypothetical protein
MYSECMAIYADSLKVSIRVCIKCGGPGADLCNLVRKMGPATAGLDDPHSGADGQTLCRSVDLSRIHAGGCGCLGYVSIGIA